MATVQQKRRTRPEGWFAKLHPKIRDLDLPFTLRFYGVTEDLFDDLVDEDTDAELLDGVMIVHSPASPLHDELAGFLRALLRCYAGKKGLGRVFGPDSLIHLASCRKVAPDAFFLGQKKVPRPLPKQQFEVPPDLAVEVPSPSNRGEDLEEKRPAYQEAGVGEIWLVDPAARRVLVDVRRKKGYVTRTYADGRVPSTVVRGFWIEASWLWSDPPPDTLECLLEILK
jgi:Uma2 family endonuclease